MEQFIRNGGGFMGVHAAADTEYDWPWYGELVGAWFHKHPVLDALRAVNLMAPPLMNALVTQLILDGSAQAMLTLVQEEAAERRYLAQSALSPRFLQHCAGVHAWCRPARRAYPSRPAGTG